MCRQSRHLGLQKERREMFREVPVLPVVVPVAAVVFIALLAHLRHRGLLSVPRAAVALAICVYVAGVVANTVFPIFLDKPRRDVPWSTFVNLVPLVDYEVADAVMNVVVFVPFGVLVPVLLVRASWSRVAGASAAFSLTIEATQLVTARLLGGGHVADVNDLMFNVLGGVVGFGLVVAASRVPRVAAVIEPFRWR
ncbi:VanZ family protein [Aeromicrobium alkaliterrae]|uniref:VanZ-like domain-containing protein n=1 Tax=Aeromicrobium alkaliterrae TaxID=302168 RepID=A0ABN2JGB7_9ACTN